jgi:hypothetical protein
VYPIGPRLLRRKLFGQALIRPGLRSLILIIFVPNAGCLERERVIFLKKDIQ